MATGSPTGVVLVTIPKFLQSLCTQTMQNNYDICSVECRCYGNKHTPPHHAEKLLLKTLNRKALDNTVVIR